MKLETERLILRDFVKEDWQRVLEYESKGNYDHCVAICSVQGYYRPLPGANPFDGETGKISEVAEYKVEVNCKRELVNEAIKVIKQVHPYEEPLINIIPLANHLFV